MLSKSCHEIFNFLLTNCLMPSDQCNSKASGLIVSLFNVALASRLSHINLYMSISQSVDRKSCNLLKHLEVCLVGSFSQPTSPHCNVRLILVIYHWPSPFLNGPNYELVWFMVVRLNLPTVFFLFNCIT